MAYKKNRGKTRRGKGKTRRGKGKTRRGKTRRGKTYRHRIIGGFPTSKKCIIFDLDDTLYSPELNFGKDYIGPAIIETMRVMELEIPGIDINDDTKLNKYEMGLVGKYGTSYAGLVNTDILPPTFEKFNEWFQSLYEKIEEVNLDINKKNGYDQIKPSVKLQTLLESLQSEFDLFIFSNGDTQHCNECLQRLGIARFFPVDHIITIDTLNFPNSEAVSINEGKIVCKNATDPDAFIKALKYINTVKGTEITGDDIVFIDDSAGNIASASNAGWNNLIYIDKYNDPTKVPIVNAGTKLKPMSQSKLEDLTLADFTTTLFPNLKKEE